MKQIYQVPVRPPEIEFFFLTSRECKDEVTSDQRPMQLRWNFDSPHLAVWHQKLFKQSSKFQLGWVVVVRVHYSTRTYIYISTLISIVYIILYFYILYSIKNNYVNYSILLQRVLAGFQKRVGGGFSEVFHPFVFGKANAPSRFFKKFPNWNFAGCRSRIFFGGEKRF